MTVFGTIFILHFIVVLLHLIMILKTDSIRYTRIFNPVLLLLPFLVGYSIIARLGVIRNYYYPRYYLIHIVYWLGRAPMAIFLPILTTLTYWESCLKSYSCFSLFWSGLSIGSIGSPSIKNEECSSKTLPPQQSSFEIYIIPIWNHITRIENQPSPSQDFKYLL